MDSEKGVMGNGLHVGALKAVMKGPDKEPMIDICGCCETPMICTFKWPQKELWCPGCGLLIGMFDGGNKRVPATEELIARHGELKEKARGFLTGETDAWEYLAEQEEE